MCNHPIAIIRAGNHPITIIRARRFQRPYFYILRWQQGILWPDWKSWGSSDFCEGVQQYRNRLCWRWPQSCLSWDSLILFSKFCLKSAWVYYRPLVDENSSIPRIQCQLSIEYISLDVKASKLTLGTRSMPIASDSHGVAVTLTSWSWGSKALCLNKILFLRIISLQ